MANLLLIRDLCEKNKIKIRELASRIGKDESSIQSMIRTGSTNTKTLEAIAEVFNVSPGIFRDCIRTVCGKFRKNSWAPKNQLRSRFRIWTDP